MEEKIDAILYDLVEFNQLTVIKFSFKGSLRGLLKGDKIGIRDDLDKDATLYTLAHELTHYYLHYDKGNILKGSIPDCQYKDYEEQADRVASMLIDLLAVLRNQNTFYDNGGIRMNEGNEVKQLETSKKTPEEMRKAQETRLNNAAYELSDEIWQIKDKVEKAFSIICEITDEYFRKFNGDKTEDHWKIAYEFSKNAVYADIVFDYIADAKKTLAELYERADKTIRNRLSA